MTKQRITGLHKIICKPLERQVVRIFCRVLFCIDCLQRQISSIYLTSCSLRGCEIGGKRPRKLTSVFVIQIEGKYQTVAQFYLAVMLFLQRTERTCITIVLLTNLFVPVTIVVCLSSLIMSVYNPLLERYFTDKAIFSSYFICFCQRPRNSKLRTISWRSLNMLHVNLLRSSKTFKWESFSKRCLISIWSWFCYPKIARFYMQFSTRMCTGRTQTHP